MSLPVRAPVPRWLDPAEGESTITPYLLLYMSPYEDLKLRR
jgi:hypothetical protein